MPGTLVSDSLEADLLLGTTLDSATSSTGTEVDIQWPQWVTFRLDTATVTGTSPTLNIEIQGTDVSGFGGTVVSYGAFPEVGNDDDVVYQFSAYVDSRYLRASIVTGGTSPDYLLSTVTVVEPHYLRTRTVTAT